MCTTGVLRLGDDDYLLFKNKDFGRKHFDDRLVVERDVFGVEGITTWAGDDPDLDEFSGFSIGANAHGLLCCDSNVCTIDGLENYDRATEIALRRGHDIHSAVAALRAAAAARPFMWGNLVMIDAGGAAAVELWGSEVHVEHLGERGARTNHHLHFGLHPEDEDRVTTQPRLRSAVAAVATASELDDVFALLRSHDDGGTGVCNHAIHHTVYSYVLRHRAGATTLYVSQGAPCSAPPIHQLALPLGGRWSEEAETTFRAAYPSARADVTATA